MQAQLSVTYFFFMTAWLLLCFHFSAVSCVLLIFYLQVENLF